MTKSTTTTGEIMNLLSPKTEQERLKYIRVFFSSLTGGLRPTDLYSTKLKRGLIPEWNKKNNDAGILLKQMKKEKIIRIRKGDYEADPKILDAFIDECTLTPYEASWCKNKLKQLRNNPNWTESLKQYLQETKDLSFQDTLYSFLFTYRGSFSFGDISLSHPSNSGFQAIHSTPTVLFIEDNSRGIMKSLYHGEDLEKRHNEYMKDVLWSIIQKNIGGIHSSPAAYSQFVLLKEFEAVGLGFEFGYSKKDYDFFLPLFIKTRKDIFQDILHYINGVSNHIIKRYYGKNWRNGLQKVYDEYEADLEDKLCEEVIRPVLDRIRNRAWDMYKPYERENWRDILVKKDGWKLFMKNVLEIELDLSRYKTSLYAQLYIHDLNHLLLEEEIKEAKRVLGVKEDRCEVLNSERYEETKKIKKVWLSPHNKHMKHISIAEGYIRELKQSKTVKEFIKICDKIGGDKRIYMKRKTSFDKELFVMAHDITKEDAIQKIQEEELSQNKHPSK